MSTFISYQTHTSSVSPPSMRVVKMLTIMDGPLASGHLILTIGIQVNWTNHSETKSLPIPTHQFSTLCS